MLVVMPCDDPDLVTDYSPDGVDLTLIRWMLSLTPAERLEFLEEHVNDIVAIRDWHCVLLRAARVSKRFTERNQQPAGYADCNNCLSAFAFVSAAWPKRTVK